MAGKNNGIREQGLGTRDVCSKDQIDINTTSTLTTHPSPESRVPSPRSLLFFVFCFLFFVGCKTTQTPESYFNNGIFPLEKGAFVYFCANVEEARSVLDILPVAELKNNQTKQMLDRTNFAMAAFFSKGSGRRFQMAAWGNYPSAGADMILSLNNNWKNYKTTGGSYWHSGADKLSIHMTSRQAFILGSLNDTPVDPLLASVNADLSVVIPEGFNDFRGGSALSCWVNDPGPVIQQMLNAAGVPIRAPVRQLFFNLNTINTAQSKKYEAVLLLTFDNATQARGMVSILNLAGAFKTNSSEMMIPMLFLSNPPVQKGAALEIKSSQMNEAQITGLINFILEAVN